MTTITDVARLADVSLSTVSHVMNGTRRVSAATRQRVLDAVAQTGYEPHGVARSLRRARTDSVGLIVTDTSEQGYAAMIRGVEQEARAAGMTLLLANSGDDPELEFRSVRTLRERRVDGLLIAEEGARSRPDLLQELARWTAPVVLIDRLSDVDLDQVGVDNVPAMRRLVTHLTDLGHRRIALIAGDPAVSTLGERMQGYLLALRDAGIAPRDDLIVTGRGPDWARDAIRPVLAGPDRPAAFVCSSTVLAVETLTAAKELGLSTPDDFALVSFDSFPYNELFYPQITSAVQPGERIGQQAMQLLMRRLSEPDAAITTLRLPATIVHGDSCGCPEPRAELVVPAGPGHSGGTSLTPTFLAGTAAAAG